MKRAFVLVAAAAALGLAACGGSSSSGASSPNDAMATFASAVESSNWSGACAMAEPSQQSDCNSAFSKLTGEKITIKKLSYTVSDVEAATAQVRFRFTVCKGSRCGSTSNTGELVKQNGNWYISNSSGTLGNSGSGDSGSSGNSGNSGLGDSGSSGNSGNSGLGDSGSSGNSGNR
jgi:hypothetical protein